MTDGKRRTSGLQGEVAQNMLHEMRSLRLKMNVRRVPEELRNTAMFDAATQTLQNFVAGISDEKID